MDGTTTYVATNLGIRVFEDQEAAMVIPLDCTPADIALMRRPEQERIYVACEDAPGIAVFSAETQRIGQALGWIALPDAPTDIVAQGNRVFVITKAQHAVIEVNAEPQDAAPLAATSTRIVARWTPGLTSATDMQGRQLASIGQDTLVYLDQRRAPQYLNTATGRWQTVPMDQAQLHAETIAAAAHAPRFAIQGAIRASDGALQDPAVALFDANRNAPLLWRQGQIAGLPVNGGLYTLDTEGRLNWFDARHIAAADPSREPEVIAEVDVVLQKPRLAYSEETAMVAIATADALYFIDTTANAATEDWIKTESAEPLDQDGDGEADMTDFCTSTESGAEVDTAGCSHTQYCGQTPKVNVEWNPMTSGTDYIQEVLTAIDHCWMWDWKNDEPFTPYPADCQPDLETGTNGMAVTFTITCR